MEYIIIGIQIIENIERILHIIIKIQYLTILIINHSYIAQNTQWLNMYLCAREKKDNRTQILSRRTTC